MEFDAAKQKDFWEQRFRKEGHVWGDSPSRTAVYALKQFRKYPVKRLLVPGSGYGRNTKLFSSSGFDVVGIEISTAACEMAREYDPLTKFYNGSILDMSFDGTKYDVIYCFNTLHLFYQPERALVIRDCAAKLKEGGLGVFAVFSEKERSFGKGVEIENNTFESRPGRPTHFFTEESIREHFRDFQILETGIMEDPELQPCEGPHTHMLRYILVKKLSPVNN